MECPHCKKHFDSILEDKEINQDILRLNSKLNTCQRELDKYKSLIRRAIRDEAHKQYYFTDLDLAFCDIKINANHPCISPAQSPRGA